MNLWIVVTNFNDSGGFQVMSLSKLNKIDREKGAIFNSHVDGKNFV